MREIEVKIPGRADLSRAAEAIEEQSARAGLTLRVRGTLARYPGCVHWHYGRAGDRGTLEITCWPNGRRIWLSIHVDRGTPWVHEAAPPLAKAIARALRRLPPSTGRRDEG